MTNQNFDQIPQPQQPQLDSAERVGRRDSGRWMPGVVLVVLGVIFLMTNLTGFELNNWWALFILIPAFGSFARAYDLYRSGSGFEGQMLSAVLGGALMTCVACVFLFGLSWAVFGPVLLIMLGGGLLLTALRR